MIRRSDNIRAESKWCLACKSWIAFENFGKCKAKKHGLGSYCHDCRRKKWSNKSINKRREIWYRHTYGLDYAKYDQLLELQNNCCAICFTSEPGGRHKRFHIDHDHETKQIRGLLCDKCNRGLGFFNDSFEILEQAVEYLKFNKGDHDETQSHLDKHTHDRYLPISSNVHQHR